MDRVEKAKAKGKKYLKKWITLTEGVWVRKDPKDKYSMFWLVEGRRFKIIKYRMQHTEAERGTQLEFCYYFVLESPIKKLKYYLVVFEYDHDGFPFNIDAIYNMKKRSKELDGKRLK
jgi:hypothetical protein